MVNPVSGVQRWVLINAGPAAVFSYLADLPRHSEWAEHSGFRLILTPDDPVGQGSVCKRERLEIFQASLLRGGVTSSEVSWIKSLTVTGYDPNEGIDFETKNIYNGLSVGSEFISFRLFPEGAGTVLVMTDKKSPHVPGLFHLLMLVMETVKSIVTQPMVNLLFRMFPGLRSNRELARIKAAVEQT